jgi:hypothetical protein
MTADTGREAVYAAEIAAFEGTSFETLRPIAELVDIAATVTGADWWPHGHIDVVSARRDASSSSTRQRSGGRPVVRLAAPQMTPATVVHELAHVLAGVDCGHGGRFRRAHVDLVGFVFGDEPATWLLDAYDAMGLAVGDRAWPVPPLRPGAGGPTAL